MNLRYILITTIRIAYEKFRLSFNNLVICRGRNNTVDKVNRVGLA